MRNFSKTDRIAETILNFSRTKIEKRNEDGNVRLYDIALCSLFYFYFDYAPKLGNMK